MLSLGQINLNLRDIRSVRNLFEVYEDLAAQKMQDVRADIERFRDYFETLSNISGAVGVDVGSVVKRNSKQRAAILVSSDNGLYGNAFVEVAMKFVDFVNNNQTDIFVVGNMGNDLVKNEINQKISCVIPSDNIDELWGLTREYQELNIFYLKYENLVRQEAKMVKMSGDLIPKFESDYVVDPAKKLSFLYEPSVFEVTELFAKEILGFLSEQTMKESDLAKNAARLMYLDSCIERNDKQMSLVNMQKMKYTKRLQNKRQNSQMVSFLARSGR